MRNERDAYRPIDMKILTVLWIALLLFPLTAAADALVLKSGLKLNSEKIWEEKGEVKCYVNGLVVGFPADSVDRIEKASVANDNAVSPAAEQSVGFGLTQARKLLDAKKADLDREYQELMESLGQLKKEIKKITPGADINTYNEKILQYNQSVQDYEHKRKALDREIEAYLEQIKKEGPRELLDEKKFSTALSSWLQRPIEDFMEKWGRPDAV